MKCIPNDVFFAWVESEIAEGHSVRFRLKGQSMFPLLRNERDEVVLYPCHENELRPMDVVFSAIKVGMYCIGYSVGKESGYICKEMDLM